MLHNHEVPGSVLGSGIMVSVSSRKMAGGSFRLGHDHFLPTAWVAQSV